MEQLQYVIEIYDGYRIVEKETLMSPEAAYRCLCGRAGRRYTEAKKQDGNILLKGHLFVCPHCGKKVPAYNHYLSGSSGRKPLVTEKGASEFVGLQLTFEPIKYCVLPLQQPISDGLDIICPKCKKRTSAAKTVQRVTVENGKTYVRVSRSIENPAEIMTIPWVNTLSLSGGFPLSECVTFDFAAGKAEVHLEDSRGNICLRENVESWKEQETGGLLCQLFSENKLLKRYVRHLFQLHWSVPLPFSAKEFSFEKCLEAVRFQNFPRCFYDTIPYYDGSMQLNESFSHLIPVLKNAETALALLSDYRLPSTKSIRRCFCNNPGLLFYVKECGALHEILSDVNLLYAVLGDERIFGFLSKFHRYPGIRLFLEDFAKKTSPHELQRCIKEYASYMIRLGIDYAAQGEEGRLLEQKKWKKFRKEANQGNYLSNDLDFSLPIQALPERIKNQTVNGFFFKILRSTAECKRAGEQLNNCLKRWDALDNPVVGIYLGQKIVAALEIADGSMLVQALAYNNTEIDEESPLYLALERWCAINRLTIDIGDDGDLDLPF